MLRHTRLVTSPPQYGKGSEMIAGFRSNVGASTRGIDFYLEKLRVGGVLVENIDVISTAGDIRPPYPFQFQAVAKIRPTIEEDCLIGIGGTPLDAVRDMYKQFKDEGKGSE
jgi:hypothetical protein